MANMVMRTFAFLFYNKQLSRVSVLYNARQAILCIMVP